MGKLLQRLKDPSRSGVYRVARTDELITTRTLRSGL